MVVCYHRAILPNILTNVSLQTEIDVT